MKVVTYARVSTDDQTRGTSLKTQRERCEAYIDQMGWELIAHESDDGVSGTVDPELRPGFKLLLERIRAGGVDALVAVNQDRISRDELGWFSLARALQLLGVAIITLEGVDTRNDSLLSSIKAVIAADERRRIAARTMSGKIERARQNLAFGAPFPYGHTGVRDEEAKVTRIVIEPREAETILRAAALVLDEKRSPHEAAMVMNSEGFRTRGVPWQGRPPIEWSGHTVRVILKRTSLYGEFIWHLKTGDIPVEFPAIMDRRRWEAIQVALQGAAKQAYLPNKTYPLSGILISPCGLPYSGQYDRSYDRRYMRCRGKDHPPRCGCAMPHAAVVEELAWNALMEALEDPDALFAQIDAHYSPSSLADPEDVLHEHDLEVKRLEEALVSMVVRTSHLPPNVTREATMELSGLLVLAKERRSQAERWMKDKERRAEYYQAISEMCERASRGLRATSLEGQVRLWNAASTGIEAVVVTCERPFTIEIRVRGLDPFTAFGEDASVTTLVPSSSEGLSFDLVAVV